MKTLHFALISTLAAASLLPGCASNRVATESRPSTRQIASSSDEYEGFNFQNSAPDGYANFNFEPVCDFLKRTGKVGMNDTCKNVSRANDITSAYSLSQNGDFWRWVSRENKFLKCQVTDRVESFKVSSHPQDEAVVYFTRRKKENGPLALWLMKDARVEGYKQVINGGGCPTANVPKDPLESDVLDYGVTPRVMNTISIVNVSLGQDLTFHGWPYTTGDGSPVYTDKDVKAFHYNACFAKSGKPFSSYLIFLHRKNGQVTKIKGAANGQLAADKTTQEPYKTLDEFLSTNKITDEDCNK